MTVLPTGPALTPEHIDEPTDSAALFPVARLLPSTVTEGKRVARARTMALAGVGVAAIAVGGLWMGASSQAAEAEAQLADAQATAGLLAAQRAKYNEVPVVEGQVTAAKGDLAAALGDEVLWSNVLAQVAATTPKDVTITTVTGSLAASTSGTPASVTGPAAAASPTTGSEPVVSTAGTLTIGGSSTNFPEIASWLDSLATNPLFAGPMLNRSTRDENTEIDGVTFEGSVGLSEKARSGRYLTEESK